MRKRLQIALMASTAIATSLSLTPLQLWAGDDDSQAITATDEHGHKVYVNDDAPKKQAQHTQSAEAPRRSLVYWSAKENRWKPVPGHNAASMRAARSAAAEVTQYRGQPWR